MLRSIARRSRPSRSGGKQPESFHWVLRPSTPRVRARGFFRGDRSWNEQIGHDPVYAVCVERVDGGILIDITTLRILLIVFIATLIRSTFGFGEALVAVPLLAFCIPLEVAAPLAVLVSITIAGIVVVQDWKKIHLLSTGWLVLSSLFGIPLGLLLLTSNHQRAARAALGAIIVMFSAYSLIGRTPLELKRDSRGWLLVCGFCAGVLGGAYGMNGPPLVVYGTLRRWSAQHFRATLQGYFLPASIIGMSGYWLAGLWTSAVTHYYLLSLPVTVPAVFLGRVINHRMQGEAFLKYVYMGLAGVGAILLVQAITGKL
jgi:uncharacterized protein